MSDTERNQALLRLLRDIPNQPWAEGLARDAAEDTRQIITEGGEHIATVGISPSKETTEYIVHACNVLPMVYHSLLSLRCDLDSCEDSFEGLLELRACAELQVDKILKHLETTCGKNR